MNEIKEARLEAGLTQQAMSDLLQIPKRTIEAWESNHRTPPKYVEKLIIEKLKGINVMKRYFAVTNGFNLVIWTKGKKGFYFNDDCCFQGVDIDLRDEECQLQVDLIIKGLKSIEWDESEFDNLCLTFPNQVFDFDVTDEQFEAIYEF